MPIRGSCNSPHTILEHRGEVGTTRELDSLFPRLCLLHETLSLLVWHFLNDCLLNRVILIWLYDLGKEKKKSCAKDFGYRFIDCIAHTDWLELCY